MTASYSIAGLLVASLLCTSEPTRENLPATCAHNIGFAAAWHRISPALYLHLREATVPPEVIAPLENSYRRQVARHLQTLADLKIAGLALDAAGIRWALIKGPALAARWPRPDMREYRDLDLLVDRHRFGDALAALDAAGAGLVDRNWPMISKQLRGELTLRLRHGTSLDLHWDPVNDSRLRRDFCFRTEDMLERLDRIVITGTQIPVLDPVDVVLHVGYHTTLSGAYRMLWLMDVRSVCSDDLDWTAVGRRAREYGVELPLALAIDRAWRVLGNGPAPYSSDHHRIWRFVTRSADSLRPVPWVPGTRGSSRVLYQNIRRTAAASVLPAVCDALRPAGSERDTSWQNPLHQDVPDGAARRDYLSLVQAARKP